MDEMVDLTSYNTDSLIKLCGEGQLPSIKYELERRGYEYSWHKKPEEYVGAIYILVSDSIPDYVKIGYADNIKNRMRQLSTAVPDSYHCYAVYSTTKRLVDKEVHKLIDKINPNIRYNSSKEFYEASKETALEWLKSIAEISNTVDRLKVNPLSDSYFEDTVTKEDSVPHNINDPKELNEVTACKIKSKKADPLTFEMIDIPVGSELGFQKNGEIVFTVKTADMKNKVWYNGEKMSISRVAQTYLKTKSEQGGRHFVYNGKTLIDIRKEKESK